MANQKKYTLKTAGPDDPIYKEGLQIYSVSSKQDYIQQRKQKEGLENQFLHPVNLKLQKFLDASFKLKGIKNG